MAEKELAAGQARAIAMDEIKFQKRLRSYCDHSLEVRSQWYSPAAIAYDKVRPRYPQSLMKWGFQRSNLSAQSAILEIGCGPGTATHSLATLGASITAIEPNVEFYRLATAHFEQCPHVDIQQVSFELFPVDAQFDVVIAATSFHWISPTISYSKSATLLKENGYLILFWNKQLQPSRHIHQSLTPIYEKYAPQLLQYEDEITQAAILESLGALIANSGYFYPAECKTTEIEVEYASDDYCLLLSTYSPYLQLDAEVRETLLAEISQTIHANFGGRLALTYRSAIHLAQKL